MIIKEIFHPPHEPDSEIHQLFSTEHIRVDLNLRIPIKGTKCGNDGNQVFHFFDFTLVYLRD
jgi:hypothetical protein